MKLLANNGRIGERFKLKSGFHVGAFINIPINDYLSVEPGILINMKGSRGEETLLGREISGKLNLFYSDVPVLIKGSYKLKNKAIVYGVLGPYAGIGFFGKATTIIKYEGEEESETREVKWGNTEDDDMKRLDYGLTIGGGIDLKSFLLEVSYDFGLANISAETENGLSIKNSVLKISFGYRFEI